MISNYNNIKLKSHQVEDVRLMLENDKEGNTNFELNSIPGSGKTYSVLFFILNKLKINKDLRVMIVVPKTIFSMWSALMHQLKLTHSTIHLLCPDEVSLVCKQLMGNKYSPYSFDYLIFDEYHTIKFTCIFPIQIRGLILISGSASEIDKLPNPSCKNCLNQFLVMNRILINNKHIFEFYYSIDFIKIKNVQFIKIQDNSNIKITNELLYNILYEKNSKIILFDHFESKLFYLYARKHIFELNDYIHALKSFRNYMLKYSINIEVENEMKDSFIKYLQNDFQMNELFDNQDIRNMLSSFIQFNIFEQNGRIVYQELITIINNIIQLQTKLSNCYIKSRIISKSCSICLDENCDRIVNCCGNSFHSTCLITWQSFNLTCPFCRNSNFEVIKFIPLLNEQIIKSFNRTLLDIITSNVNKTIIIYSSMNENLYQYLIVNSNIPSHKIYVVKNASYNLDINYSLKFSDIQIVLIDINLNLEGFLFETADILIITSEPKSKEHEIQLIGRALRPNRNKHLQIFKFKYK